MCVCPQRTVVFTSRVHPGETPASFVCEGIIDFLLSSDPVAEDLRERFVFLIVPMLNPDGCFLGNYRCCSLGYDLNRCWLSPSAWSHPSIHYLKKLLLQMTVDSPTRLDFFLDMHAHAGSTHAFTYVSLPQDPALAERALQFPHIYGSFAKEFSAGLSRICRDPNKVGTGRRTLSEFAQVGMFCYTLEVSFFGAQDAKGNPQQFTDGSYRQLGVACVRALHEFYNREATADGTGPDRPKS